MPVLIGIKYGFILVIMVGPSFFYLLRVSLVKGFASGAAFALGILLTDLVFVFSIFFGLSKLFKNMDFQIISSLVGGVVLLVSGVQYLRSTKKSPTKMGRNTNPANNSIGLAGYVLKGILINGLNPFTIILWVGILASVMTNHRYNTRDFALFAGGLLGVIISADVLKAFLAHRIARVLNSRVLRITDRILGVVFILIAARFFHFFATHYTLSSFF